MATSDFPWKVQPQEMKGTYRFSGQFFVTRGVLDALSREEISMIYHITKALVQEFDGLDYILVFKNAETGKTVWFLDALNDEMKVNYTSEHDVCTLCFPEERWLCKGKGALDCPKHLLHRSYKHNQIA